MVFFHRSQAVIVVAQRKTGARNPGANTLVLSSAHLHIKPCRSSKSTASEMMMRKRKGRATKPGHFHIVNYRSENNHFGAKTDALI